MRAAMCVGAPLVLGWGFILDFVNPGAWNSWPLRLAAVGVDLLVLLSTFLSARVRRHARLAFNVPLTAFAGYLALLLHFNHYEWFYFSMFSISAAAICLAAIYARSTIYAALLQSAIVVLSPAFGCPHETRYYAMIFLTVSTLWLVPLIQFITDHVFVSAVRSNAELSRLLNGLREGLVVYDEYGKIVYFNQNAPRIMGLSPEQLRGEVPIGDEWRTVTTTGEPLAQERYPERITLATGRPQRGVVIGVDRGSEGLRWIRVNSDVFEGEMFSAIAMNSTNPGKVKVLATFEDITEQRQSEDSWNAGRAQMLEAARLSSLGESAAGIAHEINTPLAVIHLKLDQLSELAREENVPAFVPHLDIAIKSAERIARLVRSFKSLSRDASSDDFAPGTLGAILTDVTALHDERLAIESVGLRIEVDTQISLLCRQSQIGQVLSNLIQNSLDAIIESRSKRAASGERAEDWICIRSRLRRDGGVELLLEDTGPGVPQKIFHRVLEPFFTTKPPGKGTGLGLSISRTIMQAHGGSLEVDAPARGACFRLVFPASAVVRSRRSA